MRARVSCIRLIDLLKLLVEYSPSCSNEMIFTGIGQVIRLEKAEGDIRQITIKTRPKHCALCPISTGLHAMHPLFDKHGPHGQPIAAKGKNDEEGILWVHTLCALVTNSDQGTRGLIYGCVEGGNYDDDDDDDDDDESSESSKDTDSKNDDKNVNGLDLAYRGEGTDILLVPAPNHFVMTYDNRALLRRLADFRELKCEVCKHVDKRSRRLPLQVKSLICFLLFASRYNTTL